MNRIFINKYSWNTCLRVSDEDAADFLQSQFSGDLRPFKKGSAVYGLWLDVKGKVLADSVVLNLGESHFLVLSEHSDPSIIQAQLERHIIADDVVIQSDAPVVAHTIIGDVPEDLWRSLGVVLPEAGQFYQDDKWTIFHGRRAKWPAFEVICYSKEDDEAFLNAAKDVGAVSLSVSALHGHRIDAGYPLIPQEIGPGDLPGEGRLVEKGAASIDKGCYLGQEVVARMHNVGRAQRGLFLVQSKADMPELPMELVNAEGKTIGALRSAYELDADSWFGVAIMKIRYAEIGVMVESKIGSMHITRML
jgi:folate-binding protein YgfZ